ncbi:hypothetical protein Tco_0162907 [Tanacetum coccineum]
MQNQTSSALHNAIMEASGKDRPPMLAPDVNATPVTPSNEGTSQPQQPRGSCSNHSYGIDNDIYSTVDACPNAIEMWKAIERLKQGKAIANYPPHTYDPEPKVVANDDASSKEKEIDKLMALILISFKKIYKPTNNNLRTSSNPRNLHVDNTPRSNRSTGYARQGGQYENQRAVNVVGARDNVGTQVVQKTAYHKEKMRLCKQEEAEIQLSAEQAD